MTRITGSPYLASLLSLFIAACAASVDGPDVFPPAGTLDAARKAEGNGIDVEVIDLRTLRPLDKDTIIESVKKTNRLVLVDEDWPYCGMGAGILAQLQEPLFDHLDAPIKRVCSEDVPAPFDHYLELAMQPSVEKVVAAVKEVTYR